MNRAFKEYKKEKFDKLDAVRCPLLSEGVLLAMKIEGEKMKEFKSIRFVFLKFPDSNLFSASYSEFRISTDRVKKTVKIRVDPCQIILSKVRVFSCFSWVSFLSSFGFFCAPLVPVWALFVHVSIGISPYVFLPQTSFPNQKRGKLPVSVFLNFVISHLPGVHVDKKGNIQGLSTIDYPLTTVLLNEPIFKLGKFICF